MLLAWFVLGACGGFLHAQSEVSSLKDFSHSKIQVAQKSRTTHAVSDTLLLHYPISITQAPINNHFVGILTPHIQVSDNLKPYATQFQEALLKQIQEILQKRGYQVLRFSNREALTPVQKRKIWAVLDLSGWVGVLENIKINPDDSSQSNVDIMADRSSGTIWFNFFEPVTGKVIHNFGVDVSGHQASTHTYHYPISKTGKLMPSYVGRTQLIKAKDTAIRAILSEMYAKVMQRLVIELVTSNINRYQKIIEKNKR
ncbi:HpaA family protein [Helicobacter baculiformis]|uniref:HpaA family protein n=1 Tax=Helicobacter baculiformis TaxID=427351 RepID=UPI000CF0A545